jgi:hypothetical protein
MRGNLVTFPPSLSVFCLQRHTPNKSSLTLKSERR